MGGSHDHRAGPEPPAPTRVRNAALLVLAPLVALVAIGMIALWPSGEVPTLDTPTYVAGQVTAVEPCSDGVQCLDVTIEVQEGPDAGATVTTQAGADWGLELGTAVWLAPVEDSYGLVDVRRDGPMLWLAVIVAAAILALSRWKGLAALAGLAVSMLLLVQFIIPALLTGGAPVPVAAVGAAAIGIASMGLAHGFSVRTAVALAGTLLALLLTTLLGALFTEATALTGLVSDEARYLESLGLQVDLQGLFLAGLVIGALGVLDDVTITQTAAVWEVRRARPDSTTASLFTAGMRVGTDHIAATINTLVLAYAGAALPLFLLLSMSTAPLAQSLNTEIVAQEIVRTLVGTLGIIAAVPITTGMAAWVSSRVPAPAGDADEASGR